MSRAHLRITLCPLRERGDDNQHQMQVPPMQLMLESVSDVTAPASHLDMTQAHDKHDIVTCYITSAQCHTIQSMS